MNIITHTREQLAAALNILIHRVRPVTEPTPEQPTWKTGRRAKRVRCLICNRRRSIRYCDETQAVGTRRYHICRNHSACDGARAYKPFRFDADESVN